MVPRGHALAGRRSVQFADVLGQRLKLRIDVRSFDAMCRMVACGLGLAVLARDAVQPLLRAMDLRQIALDAVIPRKQQ